MMILAVAVGAAIGSVLRYLVGLWCADERRRGRLAFGTLTVNVIGSLVLGLVLGQTPDPAATALWATGFCGGLTTYSTLGLQSWQRVSQGRWLLASVNVAANVLVGMGAFAAGWWIGAR